MMFVKEDSIIPQVYNNNIIQEVTFYDLISKKAEGKTGPLWRFGGIVNSDVKGDSRFPLLEVPPPIITQRRWYLNHMDQYPCDQWEPVYYILI